MEQKEYVTNSMIETEELSRNIAAKLKGGEILALSGDLGVGKTTFVQGLAISLGIKEKVNSPTFVIMKQYKINLKSQISKLKTTTQNLKLQYLCHMDMYRIKSLEDVMSAGILDYFGRPNTICVIEWAEKIKNILPKNTIWIEFEYIDIDKRIIRCNM